MGRRTAIDAADRGEDILGLAGQESNFLNKPWFYVEWWAAAGAAASGAMLAAASGAGAAWSALGSAAIAAEGLAPEAIGAARDFTAGWMGQLAPNWANAAGVGARDIYQTITCPPGSGQCG